MAALIDSAIQRSPMPPSAVTLGTHESAYVATTESIQLAPELNSSITHILRSKDPLDAQEFNSVEYINKIFPNGMSSLEKPTELIKVK